MQDNQNMLIVPYLQFCNVEVASLTVVGPAVLETITHRWSSLVGHVTRLAEDIPADHVVSC